MPQRGSSQTATVLGGGSWGTALAHVLGCHGYDTMLWMRDDEVVREINEQHTNRTYHGDRHIHEKVRATSNLAQAAGHAEVILVVVPSKAVREVAFELGDHVTGDQILISATKGLEAARLTRMSEVLREETCVRKVGALSGPNLAAEVLAEQPSACVVASRFEEVIEKAERMLAGPRFRIYGNFDVVGVEIAGALKNIIAIAAGVSHGLGFGANTLAMLMTRGLAEISRFGEALGAEPMTFLGLAGVGDLIATCTSELSRNHTVGRRLAQGLKLADIQKEMHMVAEGVFTTQAAHQHARRLGVDMPICEGVYKALFEGAAIESVLQNLMARASRYENSYSPIGEPATVTGSILDYATAIASREGNGREGAAKVARNGEAVS